MKTVLIGYEPAHAALLAARAHEGSIVAFDKELEWELERLDIPFISSRDYRTGAQAQNLALAGDLVEYLYSKELSWLSHRGVPLADVYAFKVQVFFQKVFYFAEVFEELLRREAPSRVLICAPAGPIAVTDNPLLHWETRAPLEALELVRGNCDVEHISASARPPRRQDVTPLLIPAAFFILDLCMRMFPRRRMCLLVADHWRNTRGVCEALPQSELVFYDRREFSAISLRDLLRYRVRFARHSRLSEVVRSRVAGSLSQMQKAWVSAEEEVARVPRTYKGRPLGPLLVSILRDVLAYQAERTIVEIEQAYALLEHERPHTILLRTTMGGQSHFVILPAVARILAIPAVELQHGLETFVDGTFSRRHRAQYMSVYGPLIKEEMERAGQTTQLFAIGSPRIDTLHLLPHRGAGSLEVLCAAPDITFSAFFDTYDACEYFDAVARAARSLPNVRITVKLRSASRWQGFYREALERSFKGVSYRAVQDEPLEKLAARADVAVTCYSTIALELMVLGVPLLVLGLCPFEQAMCKAHFGLYGKVGAVREAYSTGECERELKLLSTEAEREQVAAAAQEFLRAHYLFDGKSSLRLAESLQTLAKM